MKWGVPKKILLEWSLLVINLRNELTSAYIGLKESVVCYISPSNRCGIKSSTSDVNLNVKVSI